MPCPRLTGCWPVFKAVLRVDDGVGVESFAGGGEGLTLTPPALTSPTDTFIRLLMSAWFMS